jgi:hypothetical protein
MGKFKLGSPRVNPLKSRGFMNNSPFTSNGNTMAYNNGEPEGDDKKPKTQQQVDAEATQKAKDDLKLVSTKTRKVEGGTEKIEDFEGDGEAKTYKEAGVDPAEAKAYWDANPYEYQEYLANKKAKDQKITFIPDETPDKEPDPKPKPNPKQKGDVGAKNIGTKLNTQEVDKGDQIQGGMQPVEEVYYETGYDRVTGKRGQIRKTRTVYKKVENTKAKTEQQNREAVATTKGDKANKDLDQNVVIGSTGDSDRVKQAVDEQLQAKKI